MQVSALEAQVKDMQASYAKASDVQQLQESIEKKADLAAVDKVTGGSAQALQGLEGRLEAFEEAMGALSEALKAAETSFATKATSVELEAVKARAEVRQSVIAGSATASLWPGLVST